MSSLLDRAHEAGAQLTEQSSAEDVLAALALYKQAAWPDDLTLEPGTLAWFMADFFPRWLHEVMHEVDLLRAALALIDSPYPIDVFPDLQEQDAVFAAMRSVNRYATEQFHAMTARQRGKAVRSALEESRV